MKPDEPEIIHKLPIRADANLETGKVEVKLVRNNLGTKYAVFGAIPVIELHPMQVGAFMAMIHQAMGELNADREEKARARAEQTPHITCPRCGKTSWNQNDLREGYCDHCHDWTGVSQK